MHFPHNGNIVTIDQLSFVNNYKTFSHLISLHVPNVQVVYPLPQAYYVATRPMHSISNEKDPLLSCSPCLDLVLAIDLVTPSMGALEPNLTHVDPSEFFF